MSPVLYKCVVNIQSRENNIRIVLVHNILLSYDYGQLIVKFERQGFTHIYSPRHRINTVLFKTGVFLQRYDAIQNKIIFAL